MFFLLAEVLQKSEGSSQVYISSRSAKDCEATARELNELGPGSCIPLPADMQKLDQVERLVQELSSREKALHVLVNNAGAAWGDSIDDYPVRTFEYLYRPVIFRLNLVSRMPHSQSSLR